MTKIPFSFKIALTIMKNSSVANLFTCRLESSDIPMRTTSYL